MISDLCTKFPDTELKELLMGLNWLKLYDIGHVYLLVDGTTMNQCAEKSAKKTCRIESFRERLIVFDASMFRPEEIHIITVDGINLSPNNSGWTQVQSGLITKVIVVD